MQWDTSSIGQTHQVVSIATTEQTGRDTGHIASLVKALEQHVVQNKSHLALIFCQVIAAVT